MKISNIEQSLHTMNERSKLFLLIKEEMKRRGHWKNKARGSKHPQRNLAGANIQKIPEPTVIYADDKFTDGI